MSVKTSNVLKFLSKNKGLLCDKYCQKMFSHTNKHSLVVMCHLIYQIVSDWLGIYSSKFGTALFVIEINRFLFEVSSEIFVL